VNKDKCDELEEKISSALTRFKIKMKNGEKLISEPLLTSSSTDPENEMNNPVEFALKKMKHLISSEKRRIQTPII
jgi:ribosomal protein S21